MNHATKPIHTEKIRQNQTKEVFKDKPKPFQIFKKTKPNQTKPNQTRPGQTKLNNYVYVYNDLHKSKLNLHLTYIFQLLRGNNT